VLTPRHLNARSARTILTLANEDTINAAVEREL
jgi:hypothetical protein